MDFALLLPTQTIVLCAGAMLKLFGTAEPLPLLSHPGKCSCIHGSIVECKQKRPHTGHSKNIQTCVIANALREIIKLFDVQFYRILLQNAVS